MHRSFARLAASIALGAWMLVACGGPGGGGGSIIPSGPSASSSPTSPVLVGSIEASGSREINIRVPSSLRSSTSRLVIDVVDPDGFYPFNVVLYLPSSTQAMASTAGPVFFAPGLEGLDRGLPSALDVGPSRLPLADDGSVERSATILPSCGGACLARSAPPSLTYVTIMIENALLATVDFELYAYVERYGQIDPAGRIDPNEPANNSLAGAPVIGAEGFYIGVIDRVLSTSGSSFVLDRDFVLFSHAGTIELAMLSVDDVLNTRMDIFDGEDGGLLTTLAVGESFFVLPGDYGVVRTTVSDPRLAVYGTYEVFYQ
jgi:hypothetical protein